MSAAGDGFSGDDRQTLAHVNRSHSQTPPSSNGQVSRVVFSNTLLPAQPVHVHAPVQNKRCLIDVWQRAR